MMYNYTVTIVREKKQNGVFDKTPYRVLPKNPLLLCSLPTRPAAPAHS